MSIEGVEVSSPRVADLALRLHRAGQWDLAQALCLAVDNNRPSFPLRSDADRARLLKAVEAVAGTSPNTLRLALTIGRQKVAKVIEVAS